jgi:hypothetical protein
MAFIHGVPETNMLPQLQKLIENIQKSSIKSSTIEHADYQ